MRLPCIAVGSKCKRPDTNNYINNHSCNLCIPAKVVRDNGKKNTTGHYVNKLEMLLLHYQSCQKYSAARATENKTVFEMCAKNGI